MVTNTYPNLDSNSLGCKECTVLRLVIQWHCCRYQQGISTLLLSQCPMGSKNLQGISQEYLPLYSCDTARCSYQKVSHCHHPVPRNLLQNVLEYVKYIKNRNGCRIIYTECSRTYAYRSIIGNGSGRQQVVCQSVTLDQTKDIQMTKTYSFTITATLIVSAVLFGIPKHSPLP